MSEVDHEPVTAITMTIGGETGTRHTGECVEIPPVVEHEGIADPHGGHIEDVFTPPRAAMLQLMAPEQLIDVDEH